MTAIVKIEKKIDNLMMTQNRTGLSSVSVVRHLGFLKLHLGLAVESEVQDEIC